MGVECISLVISDGDLKVLRVFSRQTQEYLESSGPEGHQRFRLLQGGYKRSCSLFQNDNDNDDDDDDDEGRKVRRQWTGNI